MEVSWATLWRPSQNDADFSGFAESFGEMMDFWGLNNIFAVSDWEQAVNSLSGVSFYTKSWSLISCYQLTNLFVECGAWFLFLFFVILGYLIAFQVFYCSCPNFFRMCCSHQIQNVHIFHKKQYSLSVWRLNILFLWWIQLNICWKAFVNHCILFLFTFYTLDL